MSVCLRVIHRNMDRSCSGSVMSSSKGRLIDYAREYARKTGKHMQVVWSEHGGYQGFPASAKLGKDFTRIYTTEEME